MGAPKHEYRRLTEQVNVRFTPADHELLQSVCRQTCQSESDVLRQGFKTYVLELQMKNRLIQSAAKRNISYPIVN
jgi:hypothetical protein